MTNAISHPRPVFDANASGGRDLGKLPEWDLSDLYEGQDAPELKRDLDWLEDACARFAQDFEGKIAGLDAAAARALHRTMSLMQQAGAGNV